MVKIQYASDLHLEFPENRQYLMANPLAPVGDVLILAGDIVSERAKKKARPFYELWRTQFNLIISIPGNHEYYGGEVMHSYPSYKGNLAENHLLLNNESVEFHGIRFVATTLWTNTPGEKMSLVENMSNDYRQIRLSKRDPERRIISAADVNKLHLASLNFLETELKKPFAAETIVITHHLPSDQLLGKAAEIEFVKYYCATNLEPLIMQHRISHWIVGHFHYPVSAELYSTKFHSNPLGYVDEGQQANFSTSAHFSVS